jgi:anti-anti-sigma factor
MSGSEQFQAIADLAHGRIVLRGELDMDDVDAFDKVLNLMLAVDPPVLKIDLTGLTFMGSAGVACLIRAHNAHPNVLLCGPARMHLRLFEIMGLCQTFRIEGTSVDSLTDH